MTRQSQLISSCVAAVPQRIQSKGAEGNRSAVALSIFGAILRRNPPAPRPCSILEGELLAMRAQGGLLLLLAVSSVAEAFVIKRSFKDGSVSDYLTERICWWNEVCKEEFQTQFKCKCPTWSFCRSPGRYYNAFCSVAETGYIWTQPPATWALPIEGPSA